MPFSGPLRRPAAPHNERCNAGRHSAIVAGSLYGRISRAGLTYRNVSRAVGVQYSTFEEEATLMSVLFMVLYLAAPLGLATLALFGEEPREEDSFQPIRIPARSE